jgi:putative alpha-1,2-mannosidase
MGGRAGFEAMLNHFFFDLKPSAGAEYLGQEAMIGQYAHGNEPSHHIAWLYAYTDRPEIGHRLVARIARDFYKDSPAGIIGNEDAGQMSAWYVFATLGFYPVQPASGTYLAGIPLVRRAQIQVPGHPKLTIERIGNGERLTKLALAGKPLSTTAIPHQRLSGGGTLRFATKPSGR